MSTSTVAFAAEFAVSFHLKVDGAFNENLGDRGNDRETGAGSSAMVPGCFGVVNMDQGSGLKEEHSDLDARL